MRQVVHGEFSTIRQSFLRSQTKDKSHVQRPARHPSFINSSIMIAPMPSPLRVDEKPSTPGARTAEDGIVAWERRAIELPKEKTELTTALMLLWKNTKENPRRISLLNAKMHTAAEELKRLYSRSASPTSL